MDKVLSGIHYQQCLVYIKDILVHGTSIEAALGSLWWVLEVFRAAGLKSHFMPSCATGWGGHQHHG